MRKVLMVGGPRHGDTIEMDGVILRLPLLRDLDIEEVACPIERLRGDQFIARWPENIEWRSKLKPKFKVGERVQTYRGTVGFVERVLTVEDANGVTYWLRFTDFGAAGYAECELEKAPTLEQVIATAHFNNRAATFSSVDIAKAIRKAFPEAGL